ncbi:hypothetical protein SY88_00825 [Clostridiales bacterium PH28_bin88]|nr:hypothetical protein SY88_00825 [Clostridiales bacterium PH28_bin88]
MSNLMVVDTDVFIDYFCSRTEAVEFFHEARKNPRTIIYSPITEAELYAGCRSLEEERKTEAFLAIWQRAGLDTETAKKAGRLRQKYGRKNGLSLPDALIAATAEVNSAKLVTRNVRHYEFIEEIELPQK